MIDLYIFVLYYTVFEKKMIIFFNYNFSRFKRSDP